MMGMRRYQLSFVIVIVPIDIFTIIEKILCGDFWSDINPTESF